MNELGTRYGSSDKGKDEWYTPEIAVKSILPHIRGGCRVYCPFDTDKSEFVKAFKNGWQVHYSHIETGQDFFELEKPDADYIVSNPPFSKRDAVLTRLYEWQIPFAMVFNANGLFDSRIRMTLAKKYGAEVLYLYPRVKYSDLEGHDATPPFQSCYWCYKVLPEKLMFSFTEERLEEQLRLF